MRQTVAVGVIKSVNFKVRFLMKLRLVWWHSNLIVFLICAGFGCWR
jgi:hypothetical protein